MYAFLLWHLTWRLFNVFLSRSSDDSNKVRVVANLGPLIGWPGVSMSSRNAPLMRLPYAFERFDIVTPPQRPVSQLPYLPYTLSPSLPSSREYTPLSPPDVNLGTNNTLLPIQQNFNEIPGTFATPQVARVDFAEPGNGQFSAPAIRPVVEYSGSAVVGPSRQPTRNHRPTPYSESRSTFSDKYVYPLPLLSLTLILTFIYNYSL